MERSRIRTDRTDNTLEGFELCFLDALGCGGGKQPFADLDFGPNLVVAQAIEGLLDGGLFASEELQVFERLDAFQQRVNPTDRIRSGFVRWRQRDNAHDL